MNKTLPAIAVLLGLFAVAWAVLLFGGDQEADVGQEAQPPGKEAPVLIQTDAGEGGVSVSATYLTNADVKSAPSESKLDYDPRTEIVFLISLTTHAGDLLPYDLAKITVLRADGREVAPVGDWQPINDSEHHRSGYLRFPRAVDGEDVTAGSGSLDMVVADLVDVPERELSWDRPLPAK